MNTYRINEYLSLKLENGQTFIYVKGSKFMQCLRLMIQISEDKVRAFDHVNSIDEAVDVSNHLYQNRIVRGPAARQVRDQTHSITEEEEFRGHCSNIQAWAENQYDTRILHSNIAFPLLRRLTEVGDSIARCVFKEEIATRLESNAPKVINYLVRGGYLRCFTEDELDDIFSTIDSKYARSCRKWLQFIRFHERYFKYLRKKTFYGNLYTHEFNMIWQCFCDVLNLSEDLRSLKHYFIETNLLWKLRRVKDAELQRLNGMSNSQLKQVIHQTMVLFHEHYKTNNQREEEMYRDLDSWYHEKILKEINEYNDNYQEDALIYQEDFVRDDENPSKDDDELFYY